jgi:hypothetical protein
MPTVGGKKFGYSKQGKAAAKAYAKKKGKKIVTKKKVSTKKPCGCKK